MEIFDLKTKFLLSDVLQLQQKLYTPNVLQLLTINQEVIVWWRKLRMMSL